MKYTYIQIYVNICLHNVCMCIHTYTTYTYIYILTYTYKHFVMHETRNYFPLFRNSLPPEPVLAGAMYNFRGCEQPLRARVDEIAKGQNKTTSPMNFCIFVHSMLTMLFAWFMVHHDFRMKLIESDLTLSKHPLGADWCVPWHANIIKYLYPQKLQKDNQKRNKHRPAFRRSSNIQNLHGPDCPAFLKVQTSHIDKLNLSADPNPWSKLRIFLELKWWNTSINKYWSYSKVSYFYHSGRSTKT